MKRFRPIGPSKLASGPSGVEIARRKREQRAATREWALANCEFGHRKRVDGKWVRQTRTEKAARARYRKLKRRKHNTDFWEGV